MAAALALLPRILPQPHEGATVIQKKEGTEVAVILTDYCPTIGALHKIVDLYATTDISVDVDELYDPLERIRMETGCAFGAVRYPARHFEEYERIPLPPGENLEFVIIRGTVTEGGYREVYALIDDQAEQEVALETKTDFSGRVTVAISPKADLEPAGLETPLDPAARKVSLGPVTGPE